LRLSGKYWQCILIDAVFIVGELVDSAWEGGYGWLPVGQTTRAELGAVSGWTVILMKTVFASEIEHVGGGAVVRGPHSAELVSRMKPPSGRSKDDTLVVEPPAKYTLP
jgi:hypothetical protein